MDSSGEDFARALATNESRRRWRRGGTHCCIHRVCQLDLSFIAKHVIDAWHMVQNLRYEHLHVCLRALTRTCEHGLVQGRKRIQFFAACSPLDASLELLIHELLLHTEHILFLVLRIVYFPQA